MAPRGIVAAATASTFGAALAAHHVGGASRILPVTFLVIVGTVAVYGLTAVPVARRLGVTRPARSRPLLIGGDPWVIDLARALRTAGLEVLMWAPTGGQRTQIQQAAFELAPGEQLASAIGQGEQLEGVTTILLLTGEDHYNALAATDLLFLINPEGTLIPVTTSRSPDPQPGDALVLLGPGGNGTPQ